MPRETCPCLLCAGWYGAAWHKHLHAHKPSAESLCTTADWLRTAAVGEARHCVNSVCHACRRCGRPPGGQCLRARLFSVPGTPTAVNRVAAHRLVACPQRAAGSACQASERRRGPAEETEVVQLRGAKLCAQHEMQVHLPGQDGVSFERACQASWAEHRSAPCKPCTDIHMCCVSWC